jgi:hypothetical protein
MLEVNQPMKMMMMMMTMMMMKIQDMLDIFIHLIVHHHKIIFIYLDFQEQKSIIVAYDNNQIYDCLFLYFMYSYICIKLLFG